MTDTKTTPTGCYIRLSSQYNQLKSMSQHHAVLSKHLWTKGVDIHAIVTVGTLKKPTVINAKADPSVLNNLFTLASDKTTAGYEDHSILSATGTTNFYGPYSMYFNNELGINEYVDPTTGDYFYTTWGIDTSSNTVANRLMTAWTKKKVEEDKNETHQDDIFRFWETILSTILIPDLTNIFCVHPIDMYIQAVIGVYSNDPSLVSYLTLNPTVLVATIREKLITDAKGDKWNPLKKTFFIGFAEALKGGKITEWHAELIDVIDQLAAEVLREDTKLIDGTDANMNEESRIFMGLSYSARMHKLLRSNRDNALHNRATYDFSKPTDTNILSVPQPPHTYYAPEYRFVQSENSRCSDLSDNAKLYLFPFMSEFRVSIPLFHNHIDIPVVPSSVFAPHVMRDTLHYTRQKTDYMDLLEMTSDKIYGVSDEIAEFANPLNKYIHVNSETSDADYVKALENTLKIRDGYLGYCFDNDYPVISNGPNLDYPVDNIVRNQYIPFNATARIVLTPLDGLAQFIVDHATQPWMIVPGYVRGINELEDAETDKNIQAGFIDTLQSKYYASISSPNFMNDANKKVYMFEDMPLIGGFRNNYPRFKKVCFKLIELINSGKVDKSEITEWKNWMGRHVYPEMKVRASELGDMLEEDEKYISEILLYTTQTKASILKQIDDKIKAGTPVDGGDFNDIDIRGCTDMSKLFYHDAPHAKPYPWVKDFNGNISKWNVSKVTDMSSMFSECTNFNQPLNNWNVSNVRNMESLFYMDRHDNNAFNQPLNDWNVSNVTNMDRMFYGCTGFNQDISNWNTSSVTSMKETFRKCSSFNQNLNNWNVSKVTDISYMFVYCVNFNQPLNNWNVSNVTSMYGTFQYCEKFDRDISGWNVSNVTDMRGMFTGCYEFNQNLNNWNVSNVTDMDRMFKGCFKFNWPLNNWNVSKVTSMDGMFQSCTLFNQDLDNWKTNEVTNMQHMFVGCKKFNGNVSSWNTNKVTNMGGMFKECTNFNQPLNDWDVSNVTDMRGMFTSCTNFNQPLNDWSVSNVTDMYEMFKECTNFNQPLNDWDVSKVTDMTRMFSDCRIFNQNLNSWNVSNVTVMTQMFLGCDKFNGNIGRWNVSNVTYMNYMLYGCYNFNRPLNNWNVSKVTNMRGVFIRCSNFNQDISSWNVSKVTEMGIMFLGCESFNQPLDSWNVSSVTNMYAMFSNCRIFNQNLDSWNVSNVTDMDDMFQSCPTKPSWYKG